MTETAGTQKAYASWGSRVLAVIIDGIPTGLLFGVLTAAFGESTSSDGAFSFSLTGGPAAVYFIGAIGWFVYNWLILQGGTGQTVGKKLLGIGVFKAGTSEPLGAGLTFARQLAHIVDGIPCLLGYLWPLWDKEKRTFADMMIGSRAYKV